MLLGIKAKENGDVNVVRGYATGGGKTICGNDEGQEQEAVPRAKSLAKLTRAWLA